MSEEIVKVCKKHGDLTINFVYHEKNKNIKTGYFLKCRFCMSEVQKKYRYKNSDKIRTYMKNYQRNFRLKNREKVTEQNRIFRSKNREKLRGQHKKYYWANRDMRLDKNKKRYRDNVEYWKAYHSNHSKKKYKSLANYIVKLYIRRKYDLKGLIPEILIDTCRQHILLKRKLKEIKNGSKEHRTAA